MRVFSVRNAPARALSSRWSETKARRVCGAISVCLIALAGYAFTVDTRAGYYIDDFVLRDLVAEHGWPGAYLHFWAGPGVRPLGVLHIMAWHHWAWAWPVVHQAVLLVQYVVVCLLLYFLVRELTADWRVAAAGAAVFAAWHSYTCVVVWTSSGAQILPCTAFLLGALWFYVRHLNAESPAASRTRLGLSVALFAVSLLFYDQHIGAPLAFAGLALLHRRRSSPWARLLGTWPFWAASAAVGIMYVVTSAGTPRTLTPSVGDPIGAVVAVASAFWEHIAARDMALQWLRRCGAPGSFYAIDPQRFAMAIGCALGGVAMLWALVGRGSWRPSSRRGSTRLAVTGLALVLVSLSVLMASPWGIMAPRHTLLPAMGVAMVIAAGFGRLRGTWPRRFGNAALATLVLGLSTLRLGYAYEWTIRTRVANGVTESLADLAPSPASDELLVVDGVQRYGQCFVYSFGFTHAFRADCGVDARITTALRREKGRLEANLRWCEWEPVDPTRTRFFVWDEATETLKRSSFDEHLRRHPELGEPQHL